MNKDKFDGFTVNLFFDEYGEYSAHFVKMPNVSAFSDTPEDALRELAVVWKGVKEDYQKRHIPIPQAPQASFYEEGKRPFKLLVDEQLYRSLTEEAEEAGISLHTLVAQKFEQNRVFLMRTGLTKLAQQFGF